MDAHIVERTLTISMQEMLSARDSENFQAEVKRRVAMDMADAVAAKAAWETTHRDMNIGPYALGYYRHTARVAVMPPSEYQELKQRADRATKLLAEVREQGDRLLSLEAELAELRRLRSALRTVGQALTRQPL